MSDRRLAVVPKTPTALLPKGAWFDAQAQAERAAEALYEDLSDAPRYPWPALDKLLGPMRPGEVHILAASTGSGKSTFLASLIARLTTEGHPLIYAPCEVKSQDILHRLACHQLGYDYIHVGRRQWEYLPEGAREQVARVSNSIASSGFLWQLDNFQPTLDAIAQKYEEVRVELETKRLLPAVVVIDHFQQLTPPPIAQRWLAVQQLARDVKMFAERTGTTVLLSAQLTRGKADNSAMRRLATFELPTKEDIKEASAIAEVADVVITAARKLRDDITPDERKALRNGTINPKQLADWGVMQLGVEKHRLDGAKLYERCHLYLDPVKGLVNIEDRPHVFGGDDPR
jgi:replicative DNA helicase